MSNLCGRCNRVVYPTEKILGGNKIWHTFCFSCVVCSTLLNACTVKIHKGELFCPRCNQFLQSDDTNPNAKQGANRCNGCDKGNNQSLREDEISNETRGIMNSKTAFEQKGTCNDMCRNENCEIKKLIRKKLQDLDPKPKPATQKKNNDKFRVCKPENSKPNKKKKSSDLESGSQKIPSQNPDANSASNSFETAKFETPARQKKPQNAICDSGNSSFYSTTGSPHAGKESKANKSLDSALDTDAQTDECDEFFPSPRDTLNYYSRNHGQNIVSYLNSFCDCLNGHNAIFFGMNDCRRCMKKVYDAEKMIGAGGIYHSGCFTCYCCNRPLHPVLCSDHGGEVFCNQCYSKLYGFSGYGFGLTGFP